ncbi:MAG: DUF5071 domain-containing protein [Defluviitaleaceae bacterium]|nr:DUF5071 domain-containing protein [Defluviitaleaceae bacterium]
MPTTQQNIYNPINQLTHKLIPKNKFDFEPLPILMEMGKDEIEPILFDLLFWVADMNWPIAPEMVKVLIRFPDSIVPLIKEVLSPSETDDDWKWFIITGLIPELPRESQRSLMGDLRRIINNPTEGEIHSEVPEVASSFVDEFNSSDR